MLCSPSEFMICKSKPITEMIPELMNETVAALSVLGGILCLISWPTNTAPAPAWPEQFPDISTSDEEIVGRVSATDLC
ncbi:hypothetical protein HO173_002446 [Letharia columbiana]|uniref:Uncharacterized protein n=1 Tax=Letharia columbiana TaxID=112416 RepID=A0A8H6L887_9LECA|nr:uncharacterized protein HO173_002446 [Letharia columbiana]KAF6239185.1 hypothetical protein HO173_002446 [Letharia columbiana]